MRTSLGLTQVVGASFGLGEDAQTGAFLAEAIALNDRNLKAGTVRALFSRLGMDDVWAAAASTRTLQGWSGPGGAIPAGSRAKNQLNELIDNRNQIAHRVLSTALGPEAILSYATFGRALARSLAKALEEYAASL